MEEKLRSIISENIKHWRKEKDLTQDALAKKADIPYTTLAKIESGAIKNPSIQTVIKIAQGLQVSLDQLMNIK
jgi:transcriptional regulator with XRE-family HTH domain